MAELDKIIQEGFNDAIEPYIDKLYDKFISEMPTNIVAGQAIPQNVNVISNSNNISINQNSISYVLPFSTGQVPTGQLSTGQLSTGQVSTGQVSTNQVQNDSTLSVNFKSMIPSRQHFHDVVLIQANSYLYTTIYPKIWNSTYLIFNIPVPLVIFRYLFNYSYIISFIGAICYWIKSYSEFSEPTQIVFSKNFAVLFNIIIPLSGICGMILWIFNDYIRKFVKTTVEIMLPKI